MIELLRNPLTYLLVTIGIYFLFAWLQKKFHTAVFNPLLWTIVFVSGYVIMIVAIDKGGLTPDDIKNEVASYQSATNILDLMLSPVTVALALPLYMNRNVVKENWLAILVGTLVGVGTSIGTVVGLGALLGLPNNLTLALYPRGVTTAIAKEITAILGASEFVSITVAVVVLTGVVGAVLGPLLIKLFRSRDDVVVGLALGSASHAIGTSKAFDYSSKAGAIASVSIITNGLVTVVVALIVRAFIR